MRTTFLRMSLLLLLVTVTSVLNAQNYPLGTVDPVARGMGGSTGGVERNLGWRFKVNTAQAIVGELGCWFPNSDTTPHVVTLFDVATTARLAQVTVQPSVRGWQANGEWKSGGGWQYALITPPVTLVQGKSYCVVGHNGSSGSSYQDYSTVSSYAPTGAIEFEYGVFTSGSVSSPPNTYPAGSQQAFGYMQGLVDIVWFDGVNITTSAEFPIAAEGSSYSAIGIEARYGTEPYSWSTISGSVPSGMSLDVVNNKYELSGTPDIGTAGPHQFTVKVTDNNSQTYSKTMSIFVLHSPIPLPFIDDFSTDMIWDHGVDWGRGVAVAFSGSSPPRSEPALDNTSTSDNRILGHRIGADYLAGMDIVNWTASPVIDCSTATSVNLSFHRWLGCTLIDTAKIQVTNDLGTNWHDVWTSSTSSNINDNAWTYMSYDISQWAAGQGTVQVRFGIGPTSAIPNTGWCIDDLYIGEPPPDSTWKADGQVFVTAESANNSNRDFGDQSLGTVSSDVSITVQNTSGENITFGSAWTKTGANPGDFGFSAGALANPLPNGVTTSFAVRFQPTSSVGAKSATINIPYRVGAGSTFDKTFSIKLKGNAVEADPKIYVTAVVAANEVTHQQAVSGVRDFGSRDIAAGPTATIDIIIKNEGSGELGLPNSPQLGGTWWTEFVLTLPTGGMPATLASGASVTLTLAFDPTSVGTKDAELWLYFSGYANPPWPFIIPIEGVGTTTGGGGGPAPTVPQMEVRETSITGTVLANPAAATGILDFGTLDINANPGGSTTATIFIRNDGSATGDLTVGVPTFASATTEYSISAPNFPATLSAGQSVSFDITFDPTVAGTHVAVIQFAHNDTSTATPFVLNITGDGVLNPPVIKLREGSISGAFITPSALASGTGRDFGSIDVSSGPASTLTIVIMNTGTGDLTLGGVPTLSGPDASDFTLNTSSLNSSLIIAPSANAQFTVDFDPSLTGLKDAFIELTHDDLQTSSPFIIYLIGKGTDPNGVTITTTSLPSSLVLEDYPSTLMTATKGTTPYNWSLYKSVLPAGLTLESWGEIRGTLTSNFGGTFTIWVRVTDAGGNTNEKSLTITILNPAFNATAGGGGGGGCSVSSSTMFLPLLLLSLLAVCRRKQRRTT